jgi:dipeptidase
MWLGPDVSYTSCFAPFPAKVSKLPWSYQSGGPAKMDRESAWWAFDFVGNWSRLNFKRMTSVDIIPLQKRLEAKAFAMVPAWDGMVEGLPLFEAVEKITAASQAHAAEVLAQWWDLADTLVAKYSNGYLNRPGQPPIDIGYPTEWLGNTNFADGPTSYAVKFGSYSKNGQDEID